jgi:hypothetical protein
MMKDFWIYGALAAALAAPPAHLKWLAEELDGGGNYTAAVLPVVEGDRQYALLAFCDVTGNNPSEKRYLTAPFATVSVLYPTKEVQWRDTKASDFKLKTEPQPGYKTEFVGIVEREGVSIAELDNADSRYPQLVSLVLERRWLLTRHAVTAEERATAQELQECTRLLYDKPLLPYYQHAGRHFLAWMERAAK